MTCFQQLSRNIAEAYNTFEEDIISILRRHYSKSRCMQATLICELLTVADDATTTEKTIQALADKYGEVAVEEACDKLIQVLGTWVAKGQISAPSTV